MRRCSTNAKAEQRDRPACNKEEIQSMVNVEAEKTAIERDLRKVEAAENRKDIDAMLKGMTDDAILQLCGSPQLQGQAAIRQIYEAFFQVFVQTSITILGTEVSTSGDMAWQHGTHVNEIETPAGHVKQPGKWMSVLKKDNDQWKIVAISISENSQD
jgi:uncharacterized protein (TIGR02246 family)